jgi:preprotein translocase subunit SecG
MSDLKTALLARTSEILTGLWILIIILMFMVSWWSTRTQAHERCIEALKDPGVSDVVRMSICTR